MLPSSGTMPSLKRYNTISLCESILFSCSQSSSTTTVPTAGFPGNDRLSNGLVAVKGKETKLYKAHSYLLSLSLLKDLDKVMAALAEADGLFKSLTSQPSKVSTKVYILPDISTMLFREFSF